MKTKKLFIKLFMVVTVLALLPAVAFAAEPGSDSEFVAEVGGTSYTTLKEAIENTNDGDTITLLDNVEIASTDFNVGKRLEVSTNNVTIDLNGKTLTVPNHTFTLTGENITLKNGKMVATTTNASQTYGSYAVAATGTNTTIDGVTMTGGISVTGYLPDGTIQNENVSATITNCAITATNYYAVCAQGKADATIANSTLSAENGVAFFWIEDSNSGLLMDATSVVLNGSKPLYNSGVDTYGAPLVTGLTVKDYNGNEETVKAVAVSTEAHLRAMVAAGKNVMLANDIHLSKALEITKTTTIVGNDHTLTANDSRVINVNDNEDAVVLTLSNVNIDASNIERGISAYGNSDLTLIVDDCAISADHYAINIASENVSPKIIVRNSSVDEKGIEGYCAFQTWSANTNATFENCTLTGNNKWSGSSDDFATIVIVSDKGADNAKDSTLTFRNCRIEAIEQGTATEYLLSVRATGAKVSFDNCEFFVNGTEVDEATARDNMDAQQNFILSVVTYNTLGGNEIDPDTVTYESAATFEPKTPTRDGYTLRVGM